MNYRMFWLKTYKKMYLWTKIRFLLSPKLRKSTVESWNFLLARYESTYFLKFSCKKNKNYIFWNIWTYSKAAGNFFSNRPISNRPNIATKIGNFFEIWSVFFPLTKMMGPSWPILTKNFLVGIWTHMCLQKLYNAYRPCSGHDISIIFKFWPKSAIFA